MAESYRCPQCGAEVPGDAPQGLCPNCVLKAGFGTQQTDSVLPAGSESASASSFDSQYVPPMPAELASHFPDLEILELAGRGGMGVVYKARQKRLDRLVALKILAPKIGQDPAFAERFAREARAMAMLSHPHIVAVHDFGQTDGLYYFLMEFVDGVNLRRLLDTGKLAPEEALAIVPQICEALQYAHDHGVVHRDIKPENVLLDKEGRVKIADFGIAKLVGKEAKDLTLTGAGQIIGTPQYMAPEQIEHPLQVDHRADIYSLGVVFYQMLTGELPIGRFAPPSKKVQIDVRLDEVVLRALEKEPERRYQQASEIKTQVESIVTTPTKAPGATAGEVNRQGEWRTFLGIPLKERPNGIPQIVSWPGLGKAFVVLLFCGLAAILVKMAFQGITLAEGIVAAILAATVIAIGCGWIALKGFGSTRDGPSSPSSIPSSTREAVIEEARRQVKGPAIGLLVAGIFNWVLLSLAAPLIAWYSLAQASPHLHSEPSHIAIIGLSAVFIISGVMIFASLKMKRLQAYWLAVAASILAIVISPGNLIGLPIGIWALVVLSQREVRTAFSRIRCINGSASGSQPIGSQHPDGPLASPDNASGTPTIDETSRWSWKAIPWQIWVVVVLLAVEGMGNFNSLPTEPRAIEWLLAKCLFIIGLLRGWKWVFLVFQVIAAIHVVGFLSSLPIAALENLLLMGLSCSAYRFYFPRTAQSSSQARGIAWKSIVGNVILGVVALILLTYSPVTLYESIWHSCGFGGQSRIAIAEALEDYRKTLVTYDLDSDSVFPHQKWAHYDATIPHQEWSHYDADRLKEYPTKDDWPKNVLGRVHTNPGAFTIIGSNPTGQSSVVVGPNAFLAPLDRMVAANVHDTTLLFLKGITRQGSVVAQGYTSLVCLGQMRGRLSFDSYATAFIKGDASGDITSRVYFNLVVTGKSSGNIYADSYAMMYLLGGCKGHLNLRNRARVYIGGRTTKDDLNRIQGKGEVYLEDSDLAAGVHKIGNLIVTVGGTTGQSLPDSTRTKSKPTNDMQAYLNETQELVRQQCYAEALERFVWFHDHALEHNPGMSGVRLSFALSYWKNLGDVYPPAKQAMVDIRNRKAQQLQENRGNAALFQDVAELNRTLGEDAKTVRLFQEIDKSKPTLASECWVFARDAVFREKQYDIAKKYVPATLKDYDQEKARYDENVALYEKPQTGSVAFRQWNEKHFVDRCLQIIELAIFTGDKTAAQEIRKRASSIVNNPRLQETPYDPASVIIATGKIEPESVVDVVTQVAGQITTLGDDPRGKTDPSYEGKTIDYGSPVEEGTVLARIDDAVYKTRAELEKAKCERAEAELKVVQAKAKEKADPAVIAAEAAVAQAKAALKEAEINLDRTAIRSPINGVVVARWINIGQNVAPDPNAPSLFLVAKTANMQLWASVNDDDIHRIHDGMTVTFTVDAYPKDVFTGKVLQVRLNATRTMNIVGGTVVVAIDDPAHKLLPYMEGNVQFPLGTEAVRGQSGEPLLQFSPVIERVVNHSGKDCLIDLDSGKLFTDSPESHKGSAKAAMDWVEKSGIDAGGYVDHDHPGLIGFDMIVVPVANERWNHLTHFSLWPDAISSSKPGNPVFLTAHTLPTTFLFKTREGGMGILQVVSFTYDPKGVHIRYKLAQQSLQKAREASGSTGSEDKETGNPEGPVLIYEVDPSFTVGDVPAIEMDKLLKAIDRRLNTGPDRLAQVRKLDDGRIEVALMRQNDEDKHRVERLLARPGTLEFRILASSHQDKSVIERAEKEPGKVEVLDASGKRLAWWVPVKSGEEKNFANPDIVRRTKKRDNREILEILVVPDPYNITGAYLTKAEVQPDRRGQPCIDFTFNEAGGQLFAKLTGDHLPDKLTDFTYKLGIILDGELWSAPSIQSTIHNKGQISGSFTNEQASEIADVLNAGSLPVRLHLAEKPNPAAANDK